MRSDASRGESPALSFCRFWGPAKMLVIVHTCAVREASKTGKTDNKRTTSFYRLNTVLHKSLIIKWLPRMDSNHDKVIQSYSVYNRATATNRLHTGSSWSGLGVALEIPAVCFGRNEWLEKPKEPTESDAALGRSENVSTGFGKRTGRKTAETYRGDSVKMPTVRELLNGRPGRREGLPRSDCRI
jgi:hypothetical protein